MFDWWINAPFGASLHFRLQCKVAGARFLSLLFYCFLVCHAPITLCGHIISTFVFFREQCSVVLVWSVSTHFRICYIIVYESLLCLCCKSVFQWYLALKRL
ncbi:unnamed protein product [Ixodes pacificus]